MPPEVAGRQLTRTDIEGMLASNPRPRLASVLMDGLDIISDVEDAVREAGEDQAEVRVNIERVVLDVSAHDAA